MTKFTKSFRFQPNTYDYKTQVIQKNTQLLALINEPTLKTHIRPILNSANFIIGNLVTNVKLKKNYATTQSKSSILNSNLVNARRKKKLIKKLYMKNVNKKNTN
jgi:hypothetical protein